MSPRVRASVIYALYFGALGSFMPFINLYYQGVGMSKQEIGILIATATITALIASPLWSALADAFGLHRFLLPLATFGALLPMAALSRATSFRELLLAIVGYALFIGPAIPLIDSAVLTMLGADQGMYGRLRLWGSVGWAVSSLSIGLLSDWLGLSIIFVVFVVLMSLCSWLTLRLPMQRTKSSEPFLKNLRHLFANPAFIGFLLAILMIGLCANFILNFLVLYFHDLGASDSLFGLGVSLSGLSELPIFFFSALLIRRLSPSGVLGLAFLTWVLRAFLISVMPTPEAIVLTQMMHGLSFSALWAAAVVYVARLAPPGLGATAQSTISLVMFSIAGALGGWLGANLYDLVGPQNLFRIGALLALAGFSLFMLVEMRARRQPRLAEMPHS